MLKFLSLILGQLIFDISTAIMMKMHFNHPRLDKFASDYYHPCVYPVSGSDNWRQFFATCSTSYLNSSIFCDPNALLSFTEAKTIGDILKADNFSTCFCRDFPFGSADSIGTRDIFGKHPTENCSDFKIAIVLIERAALLRPSSNVDRSCDHDDEKNLHKLSLRQQLQRYVETMKQNWRLERNCRTDVFVALIRTWLLGNGYEIVDTSYLIPILSDRLKRLLPSNDVYNLASIQTVRRYKGDDLIYALRNYVKIIAAAVRAQRNRLRRPTADAGSIPGWAIVVLLICILLIPFCVFLGNILSFTPRKASKPDQVTIRMANQRWRAGFGAGLWSGANNGGEAIGSKSPMKKHQSNIMMFRNFHKTKDGGGGGHVNVL